MDVEFDPAKDAENVRKHGISLIRASDLSLSRALTRIDARKDYGEVRFRSLGLLDGNLHVLVFTLRGEALRAISLRRANRKEIRRYDEATEVWDT